MGIEKGIGWQKIARQFSRQSRSEIDAQTRLDEIGSNLSNIIGLNFHSKSLLTLRRQTISRILYYNNLYKKIIDIPGVICEFGVQWGATLSELISLRGIYEPYNFSRKIYGFDTFEGFPSIDIKDGALNTVGDYNVNKDYENTLEEILTIHESFSPLPHIKKFDLVKGDVSFTIDPWLSDNPHVIISMAIFDMDLYLPTKKVLNSILPRLTKGSLLVFDELNSELFPGETQAVLEVIGTSNIRLRRDPHQPWCAWAVFGE